MKIGDTLVASQLSGDFTLPQEKNKKIIFIAGGIGITPFRSMLKYLIDQGEKRDIIIFYSNKTLTDFAYTADLDEAESKFGIKTIYTLTDKNLLPPTWVGETGFIDMQMIKKHVPDFVDRHYYISGPNTLVSSFEKTLEEIGIDKNQITKDFFQDLLKI